MPHSESSEDEDGGKFSRDPRLRGCGAGAATVTDDLKFVGGVCASVTDPQTVPRAELTAACLILQNARQPNITIT